MSDTQPPEPSILDSLTRDELIEAILLREHERDAFHDANTAAAKIAAFNLRGWRTALARAERAEGRAEELFGELEEAKQQREDAETERNCQAATDAATIAELQASLAVMTNDRDHLMKSAPTAAPPAAPDGAPRFKVGDKVAADADRSFVCTVTAVHDDGRYSIKDADGVPSRFFWSDDELVAAPKPALRPFDAIVEVNNCTVTMRVTATPGEVFGKFRSSDEYICAHDGLYLLSSGISGLFGGTLSNYVYVWSGGELDRDDTTRTFPTPAEATAYAAKVRALLDAANAQWAEKGVQP